MKWMTLKQACEYLSISEATGRNWMKQGRLTPDHYDDRKRSYFAPGAVKEIKEHLQQSGKLTKRRNKTAICSRSVYTDYLDCDEETARQLNRVIVYCQETDAPLIGTIAHYAKEFFQSAGTLKKYTSLVDDLLALASDNKDALEKSPQTAIDEKNAFAYPSLPFQPYKDLLGYLYISLTQLDRRKKSGIYYTPSSLAKRLIERTAPFNEETDTFFDPACGTGNFLLQILSYTNKTAKDSGKKESSKIRLIGQETDPAAIAIARINIALNTPAGKTDTVRKGIRIADSLLRFPLCKNTLIFGNPPWGASLPHRYPDSVKDSAALFLQNAILHQSENGIISFLLPASLLTAKQYSKMRKILLENTRIISIDYLAQSFTLVNCPSIILTLQKDRKHPGIRRCDVYKKAEHYTIHNRSIAGLSLQNSQSTDYFPRLHADDASYALFCTLDSLEHTVRLRGSAEFALGIVTGDNDKFLIPSDRANNRPYKTSDRSPYASVHSTDTEALTGTEYAQITTEPIIRGFNLNKYRLHGPFDRIRYTPERFQQCAKESCYRVREKLLYRFIGKTPVFAYDNHGYLTLNSCNILIPRLDGMDIKYILAVLNSNIAAFYWRIGFDSVKLLKSHIEALPIPMASATEQKRIVALVDKILTDEQNYDIMNSIEDELSRLYKLTEEEHFLIQTVLSK